MLSTKMQLSSRVISRRTCVVVKATDNKPVSPLPTVVPVTSTPSTPLATPAAPGTLSSAAQMASNAPKPWSFGDAMAFSGPGPEIINGRLAMLGFVAAIGAEISTQESIMQQFGDAKPAIIATFVAFIIASLVPLLKGANIKEAFGIFTPNAELINGRAAMLGFAAVLIIERLSGHAFV